MVVRAVQNNGETAYPIYCKWVSLEKISDNMIRSVIASEDQKFPYHKGFDLEELERMRIKHETKGSPIRGCSTISQQTAKNCFTFCTHSWFRKGVEAYYTVLIEKIWGKHRIMEVYLNVAEMGPGIYGVEAAADKYFNKHASALSATEAASIACCLPNPLKRNPSWVSSHYSKRRSDIIKMASRTDIAKIK